MEKMEKPVSNSPFMPFYAPGREKEEKKRRKGLLRT